MNRLSREFRKVFKHTLLVLCAYSLPGVGLTPLVGQLNQNCVVSVLNRTVAVREDGTFVLPNVPAGFGQVRARATCVENGQTRVRAIKRSDRLSLRCGARFHVQWACSLDAW